MEKVEERVTRLETTLEEFIRTVGLEFNKVYNMFMLSNIQQDRIISDIANLEKRIEATRQVLEMFIKESEKNRQEDRQKFNEFKEEMLEFKNEMKAFKDEMLAFKNEMKAFKDEMLAFKNEMKAFKDEMLEFKNEMKAFKDEMLAFKNEMKTFKDEMLAFKNEMKDFKDGVVVFQHEMEEFKEKDIDFKAEIKSFKEEMREEHRKMNKQWGHLANKMGTIVEDIIYPATRPVLEKYFNCELLTTIMNITRKANGIKDEFDVIAVSRDMVFLIEVKSTMRTQYVDDFKNNKIKRFRMMFQEYSDKKVIPIMATLRYEESMLNYVTNEKIYAMAYREWDYMDILNFDEIEL